MGNGYYKAAIFLATLGEDSASEIMKTLDPKELKKLGTEIKDLSDIPEKDLKEVYEEFEKTATEPSGLSVEGKSYIEKLLSKTLGDDKAGQFIENMAEADEGGMKALKWMEPKQVASLIKGEHPQTVALILTSLDTSQASQVLPNLPEWLRSDVMIRMATLEDIPPGVMREIGAALQSELSNEGESHVGGKKIKGVKLVANILNQVDQASEQAIMGAITENNAELAENIRSLMFVFDDLTELDDRSIQGLMKEISKEDLTLALRAAKEEIKDKFFSNMSDRAAQLLKEDMDARGPVKVSEVEKAQQMILKTAKNLAEKGTISLGGKGGGGGEALI